MDEETDERPTFKGEAVQGSFGIRFCARPYEAKARLSIIPKGAKSPSLSEDLPIEPGAVAAFMIAPDTFVENMAEYLLPIAARHFLKHDATKLSNSDFRFLLGVLRRRVSGIVIQQSVRRRQERALRDRVPILSRPIDHRNSCAAYNHRRLLSALRAQARPRLP